VPGGTGLSGRPPGIRERVPPPLIKRRLPSNAAAMTQPNVTGDGDTPLTVRFWALVAVTGVATGLLGDLMMLILFSVAHLVQRGSSRLRLEP
jgi:CIC family chloride channel protein